MTTTNKFQPQKPQKGQPGKAQILESFRDLAGGAADSFAKDLLLETPKDFLRQMFALPERRVVGDLIPGETLEMKEAMNGQAAEKKILQAQLFQERRMRQEENNLATRKQQELRMQLSILTQEVGQLAQTTQGLTRETQIAAMQSVVDPGTYHLIFFEKLIEFLHSFRKNIEDASVWLASYNTKSKKRANSFWGQVGGSGAKRLLSAEDYLQRAAA